MSTPQEAGRLTPASAALALSSNERIAAKTQAVRGLAPASTGSHVRRAARLTLALLPE